MIVVRYDTQLGEPDTWRLREPTDEVIEVRLRTPAGGEVVVDFEARWMRSAAQAPGAIECEAIDASHTSWTTRSARLHPELPRLKLALMQAPEHAVAAMRLL